MGFIKKLFRKKLPYEGMVLSNIKTIPEKDVKLLAMMCSVADPHVHPSRVSCVYAYYVPSDDKYLNLAKHIFAKSGINMRVHFSHMVSTEGSEVLRIPYIACNNPTLLEDNIRQIRTMHVNLFQYDSGAERRKLNEVITDMLKKQELQK